MLHGNKWRHKRLNGTPAQHQTLDIFFCSAKISRNHIFKGKCFHFYQYQNMESANHRKMPVFIVDANLTPPTHQDNTRIIIGNASFVRMTNGLCYWTIRFFFCFCQHIYFSRLPIWMIQTNYFGQNNNAKEKQFRWHKREKRIFFGDRRTVKILTLFVFGLCIDLGK